MMFSTSSVTSLSLLSGNRVVSGMGEYIRTVSPRIGVHTHYILTFFVIFLLHIHLHMYMYTARPYLFNMPSVCHTYVFTWHTCNQAC